MVEYFNLSDNLRMSRVLTGLWQIADLERKGTLDPKATAQFMKPYVEAGFTSLELDHVSVEQTLEDQDSLVSIAAGLEGLQNVAQASLVDGGLKRQSATLLALGVESYTAQLGLPSGTVPSVEAFGSDGEAITATQVSVEAIADQIKKVWEAIKAAIMKAIAAVKKWWANFSNQLPKVKTRAEAIVKAAEGINGDAKNAKVTIGEGVANRLAFSGKLAPLDKTTKALLPIAADFGSEYLKTSKEIVGVYATVGSLDFTAKVDVEAQEKLIADAIEATNKSLEGKLKLKMTDGVSQQLPGGQAISLSDSASKVSVVDHADKKDVAKGDLEQDTMPATEIIAIANEAISVCDALMASQQSVIDGIGKSSEEVQKVAKDIVDGIAKADDKADKGAVSFGNDIVKKIGALATNGPAGSLKVFGYTASTLNAVLSVCDESVKQY